MKAVIRWGLRRGAEADIARALQHRPELFGRPFLAWVRDVMHGPSAWSEAERELFAAFVSRQNACAYCVTTHTAGALRGFPAPVVQAALADPATAPLAEPVRATLLFLARLASSPGDVGPADVEPLRALGISDDAIADAVHVCAIMSVMNRLADALDFQR